MKLDAAYSRLLSKAARTREEIDAMTLAAVEAEIERLSRLVRAWQVVAHSRRTSERWETTRHRQMKQVDVSPETLRLLTDRELKDLTNTGGNATTRRMINEEVLRRSRAGDRL
jgi:hypothetical protein